jgi:hypothetical protein
MSELTQQSCSLPRLASNLSQVCQKVQLNGTSVPWYGTVVGSLHHEMADVLHHTAYQVLFTANCAHPDIQTAVSFLTTRVQSPDEDAWEKLKRILKY